MVVESWKGVQNLDMITDVYHGCFIKF
jgi:hypothetical protein